MHSRRLALLTLAVTLTLAHEMHSRRLALLTLAVTLTLAHEMLSRRQLCGRESSPRDSLHRQQRSPQLP